MKLLIVGFDGLDSRFFGQTELPHLKELRGQSQWGTLHAEIAATPPAWTTVLTGWRPTTHGLIGYGASDKQVWFGNRPHDYIFDELGRAGYTVGVLNLPTLLVPRAIDGGSGWMIAGWPYAPRVWPSTLEVPGDYYTDISDYAHRVMPEYNPEPQIKHPLHYLTWCYGVMTLEDYRAFAWANQKLRIEIAKNAAPVEVLIIQCNVVDRTGHYAKIQQVEDVQLELRRSLELVDWSLGELTEEFRPEHVALVSDHGFWGSKHSRKGVWALRGPDVYPLRLDTGQENFMPTVLDALGIEVKRDGTSVLVRQSEQDRQSEVLEALGYL